MIRSKSVLCVIPARGGSKRIPGKNLRPLNGRPLITYAIQAAQGSRFIDKLIVSTEDSDIAAEAIKSGVDVPFLRPPELARDTTPTAPVLQHAVRFLEGAGESFDLITLVQPTVPGVTPEDIDAILDLLVLSGANSGATMTDVGERPELMYSVNENGVATALAGSKAARTQDMPPLSRLNGAVYATRCDVLLNWGLITDQSSLVSIWMPRERSVDIDTEVDFRMAEFFLSAE